MPEFLKYIHDEWATLSQAPFTLVTLLALLSVVIWKIFDWNYSARLESINSQLDLSKSVADEYKRKLDGASPDEAKDKVDALETRISFLEKETREAAAVDYKKIFDDNLRKTTFTVGATEP